MNWRAITSSLSQACLSVYNATREIVNVAREALSPQGMERSYEALKGASLSYFRDLRTHPLVLLNPFTVAMAPGDILSRLKTSDQQRILLQAGLFGLPAILPGVLPLSPVLAGLRSYLSSGNEPQVGLVRALGESLRQILPITTGDHLLISPVGTPSVEAFGTQD